MKKKLTAWATAACIMATLLVPVHGTFATEPSDTATPGTTPDVVETLQTETTTETPSVAPSATETETPSVAPIATETETPSAAPTATETEEPSAAPTATATEEPSAAPTATETEAPSAAPSATVSEEPSAAPSATATEEPSVAPSDTASSEPSVAPSATASEEPSAEPTATPAESDLCLQVGLSARSAFAGDEVSAQVEITGGTAPYTIALSVKNGDASVCETTATAEQAGAFVLPFSAPAERCDYTVTATVTDALGAVATGDAVLPVAIHRAESSSVWEETVRGVALTQNWRENLVNIAKTQVGYAESTEDFRVDEDGNRHGYTRYGDWYADAHEYNEWCAMFVSFCLNYAGVKEADFPRESQCGRWQETLRSLNAYADDEAAYVPVPGDLVFFNYVNGDECQHVGIVETVTDAAITVIEGNCDNAVCRKEYAIVAEEIVGYANIRALMARAGLNENGEELPIEMLPVELPEGTISCATNGESVNVREKPVTTSECVAQIAEAGTVLMVLDAVQVDEVVWYHVSQNEMAGYIRGDLVTLLPPEPTVVPTETTLAVLEQPQVANWTPDMEAAAFNANITGATSYVWQRGTKNESGEIVWQDMENTNSACIMLPATMEDARAYYRCMAFDANGGFIVTEPATLVRPELVEWLNATEATEEMLVRAIEAKSLDSLVLEGTQLVYVNDGTPIAQYNAETGELTDIETNTVVAYLDQTTQMVYRRVAGAETKELESKLADLTKTIYDAWKASDPLPAVVQQELTSGPVTVSGLIPEGVTLNVTDLNAQPKLRMMTASEPVDLPDMRQEEAESALARLDITLYNPDGTEWQPEKGEKMRVTLDAEALGLPEGLIYSVRHIHENGDGTSTEELLGPYVVSEGKAVFELTSFSYVIIIKANGKETKIENVQSFYTVSGTAGNKHIHASGVYFTQEGNAHLLLTANQEQHATSCWASTVTINNEKIETFGKSGTDNYGPVSEFKLQNGDNTADVTNLLVDAGYNYVIDIDLGKITLTETFTISVTWNDGKINGFAIDGMQVQVVFNDGISKEVYSVNDVADTTPLGEATEVKAGDVIIYKIVVKNGSDSTQSVTGSVVDILPAGIFESGSVYYAADNVPNTDAGWTAASVSATDNQFTIAESVTIEMGGNKTYYVKATVANTAQIGQYENRARFVKGENNYRESTATIEVTTPPVANLTITKSGWDEIDENQSFVFKVTGPDNYSTLVVIHGNGSVTIKGLKVGTYTVTEVTDWSWRYNSDKNTQQVELTANSTKPVTFNNLRPNIKWLNGCAYADNKFTVNMPGSDN